MIFTIDYDPKTGASSYVSQMPLESVLLLVNKIMVDEAIKRELSGVEQKKSKDTQAILTYANSIAMDR